MAVRDILIFSTVLTLLLVSPAVFARAENASTTTESVSITVRDGSLVAFSGSLTLPASTTPDVEISPSGATTTISVPADTLLAEIVAADATSSTFDITDLQYFSSFNSFYINCISIPIASSTPLCANWQFVVNGSAPQVGADHVILHNGDNALFYFGFPRQASPSKTTVETNEQFTVTAETYDPSNDTFAPAPGVIIGITQPNPTDAFTPTIVATSTANSLGQVIFSLAATGTYAVGIAEDFFFPSTPLSVTEAATSTASTTPENPPTVGSGGGSINTPPPAHTNLNTASALAFLVAHQHTDGSFDSPLLSDWAAIALASTDAPEQAKDALGRYLISNNAGLSSATDYERHAMALMALGINPYSGTRLDYVAKILSFFDGVQFGSTGLVNDDIFALFPLTHAGYGTSDTQIASAAAFIVSKQKPDGSWEESTDLTASAVQALSPLSSLSGVSSALNNAKSYLHSQQQQDGGFGNSFSTSWSLQALAALGDSLSNWMPSSANPQDYLASLQQSDGGMELSSSDALTRVWATEYAIPASLSKTWNTILTNFPRPSSSAPPTGGASTNSVTTVATTTTETGTTTQEVLGVTTSTITIPHTGIPTTTIAATASILAPVKKAVVKKSPTIEQIQVPEPANILPVSELQVAPAQTAAVAQSNTIPESFSTKIAQWFTHLGQFFYDLLF